ncbi:MAG: glycosyltransferase, partial [Ginsengibacter sp.]
LIYLSLIAEKKNLHLLLSALQKTHGISLDIFGPIKDKKYWQICKNMIDNMSTIARYMGDAEPANVQHILQKYDALALLTKGENFGHAIYESLSVGRPVVISNYTPWQNLADKQAGWNTSLNGQEIREVMDSIKLLDNQQHQVYCEGAYKLAGNYFNTIDVKTAYGTLFNELYIAEN